MSLRDRSFPITGSGAQQSSRPWTPFGKNDDTSSPPRSSSASVRHLRGRHFFSRGSSSDSSSIRNLRPSPSSKHGVREISPSRPTTANSEPPRHRKTDTLDSIRSSIFGGLKREPRPLSRRRTNSNLSLSSAQNGSVWAPEHFDCEEDYYRHLTKQSISPPFHFQHVTHTAKGQFPSLETVDEKDLPGEFWSVSAYQKPKHHLNGIKAEDLRGKPDQKEPPSISSPSRPASLQESRPISPLTEEELTDAPHIPTPTEAFDDLGLTMFDESEALQLEPEDEERTLQPAHQVAVRPERSSSLTAPLYMNAGFQPLPRHARSESGSSDGSGALGMSQLPIQSPPNKTKNGNLNETEDPVVNKSDAPVVDETKKPVVDELEKSTAVEPDSLAVNEAKDSVVDESEVSLAGPLLQAESASDTDGASYISPTEAVLNEEAVAYRLNQPLPPLPHEKIDEAPPVGSLESADVTRHSKVSLQLPTEQAISPIWRRSSRASSMSSRSVRKSPAYSSFSDMHQSSVLSDTTWEDDVDFCYRQEAEATCDFNWDVVDEPSRSNSILRLPPSPYHAHSPDTKTDDGFDTSREPIAERRRSQMSTHTRGTSVGHRGFLAARNSSKDLNTCVKQNPAPIQVAPNATPNSTQVSVLSPIFSVTGADDENPKSPLAPSIMNLGRLEGLGLSSEYLSDPESYRNSGSAKHRQSSSCGSHGSSARSLPNPARDMNRWSVASSNSLPDLMHSRPRSKLFLSKAASASPLESLPQSPPGPDSEQENGSDSTIVPSDQSDRNSFVMRRPGTTGDRAVLYAAGRFAQQRAGTPQRLSRVLQPGEGVPEAESSGPAWI